jgi:hypothetical protein
MEKWKIESRMFFCILRIKETSPHPENKQGAEHTRQRAGRKIGPQSMILTIQDKHNSPKLAGRRIRALSCRHAPIRKPMQPTQLTCHNSPKMAARRIRVLSCRHAPIRNPIQRAIPPHHVTHNFDTLS